MIFLSRWQDKMKFRRHGCLQSAHAGFSQISPGFKSVTLTAYTFPKGKPALRHNTPQQKHITGTFAPSPWPMNICSWGEPKSAAIKGEIWGEIEDNHEEMGRNRGTAVNDFLKARGMPGWGFPSLQVADLPLLPRQKGKHPHSRQCTVLGNIFLLVGSFWALKH